MRRKVDEHTRLLQGRFPTKIANHDQFVSFIYNNGVYPYVPETPPIDAKTKLITIGSCFSAHVATALDDFGLDVTNYEMSERIFTTFALKEFIAGVKEGNVSSELIDDVEENRENIARIRQLLTEGATVIFTLGLSFCWFNLETDQLVHTVLPKTKEETDEKGGQGFIRSRLKQFEMRQTSIEDNAENILQVIETIKELNPENKIIFTISPIPLQFCKADQPLLTSDFISKSVLRMAVSEIEKVAPDNVFYFPSFEIVRWASPHMPAVFWGSENTDGDPRHVDSQLIKLVVKTFVSLYTSVESG